uniref:Tudor domain-containing protein n=1 Tax=Parascaris univalens TaxID=6257 RepID=A0A915BVE8_PARUN
MSCYFFDHSYREWRVPTLLRHGAFPFYLHRNQFTGTNMNSNPLAIKVAKGTIVEGRFRFEAMSIGKHSTVFLVETSLTIIRCTRSSISGEI